MRFIKTVLLSFMSSKRVFSLFILCMVVEVAYAAAAPLSLKYLVDGAFVPKNPHVFFVILGILVGAGILNLLANLCGDYALGKLSGEAIRKLRLEMFGHVQKQSIDFFHRFQTGDLVTRFISDMAGMEKVIRGSFPFTIRESLSILLGLIMLFTIEWKLTLAMLAGPALMFIGPRLLQGRAESANMDYKQAQERFSNTIDEMIKGHKTIKSLHLQKRLQQLAQKHIHELFSFGFRLHAVNALMERLPLTALLLLNGIMLGFGGYLIFHDELTVGGFMAFFTLFMSVGQAASNLSFLLPSLVESSTSFTRIREILDHKPGVPEASDTVQLPPSTLPVRMEQVSFGYNEEALQLQEVSLHIEAGSYVAFVGPSGSGKSTALQLLSRFYDPLHGRVAIGGNDLRSVSEESLRRHAVLVTQDSYLFHGSIRDNLLLDSTELKEEDLAEAVKQVNLHYVIQGWPNGYDTQVQQGGDTLSGGERQRLSLARALLRRPKLLLLDEVTSALDPAAEAEINRLIEGIRGRQTIVSVTHRLASVVGADRIYVFQGGRIVESGTHEELLMRGGLYSSLWGKQHGFHLSPDGLHATVEVERLAQLPFFDGIEPSLLRDISRLFATETCHEGERIICEGEEGNKCYIMVRGKVEVLKQLSDGEPTRVAVLQDGDHFGEIALLKGIPRTATVRALVPSILLSIRREAFAALMSEHPHIRRTLEQVLAGRMG